MLALDLNNDRELRKGVMSELCIMCKDVQIVHEKSLHSQVQGFVERAYQNTQNILP